MESNTIDTAPPSSNKNDEARRLFLRYGGSYFHMQREGELQQYLSYGISKQQERAWAQERRDEILPLLDARLINNEAFRELVRLIVESKDADGLHLLVNLVETHRLHLDTFTAIRIAEDFFRIHGNSRLGSYLPKSTRKAIWCCINHLLETIDEENVTVDPYYRTLPYLVDILTQEHIAERVKELRESVQTNG